MHMHYRDIVRSSIEESAVYNNSDKAAKQAPATPPNPTRTPEAAPLPALTGAVVVVPGPVETVVVAPVPLVLAAEEEDVAEEFDEVE